MHFYQQSKAQPQNQPCNGRIMSVNTLNIGQLLSSTENIAVPKGTTNVNAITQMARKHLQKNGQNGLIKRNDQVTNQPTNQTTTKTKQQWQRSQQNV